VHFNTISFINSKGNLKSNNYSYTDNNASDNSIIYYRIKESDISGSSNYSSIVLVNLNSSKWYVSDVANNATLHLQLDQSSNVIVQVITIDGVILNTINKGNLSKGIYTIPLGLNDKPAGIYVVKLILNQTSNSIKVFKP